MNIKLLNPKIVFFCAAVLLVLAVSLLLTSCATKPKGPPLPVAGAVAHASYKDVLAATTNRWFFAATATDKSNLTSDYSNEVSLTDTNGDIRTVTLAWDRPTGTNVITNYTIWQGAATRVYTNSVKVGTNLTETIRVQPPLPLPPTNLVITVTGQAANSLQGPWLAIPGWSPIVLTNPAGMAYYRVSITSTNQ